MKKNAAAALLALWLMTGTASAQEVPSPQPSVEQSPLPGPSTSPVLPTSPSPQPLAAVPASVQSNVGAAVTVTVSNGTLPLTAVLVQKTGSVSVAANVVTISPVRNGTDTLRVTDAANATIDIPVKIAPNAGTIAPSITVKVTGDAVDPAFVAQQAALALDRATLTQPFITKQIGVFPQPALPLGPGGTTAMTVPVSIAGGDQYLDVSGSTQVNVQNVGAAAFEPVLLYYSDDPERLQNDGVLYRGTVGAGQPVRLYDYHENGAQRRRLVVVLSSAATGPASVQIVESFAGPNADVMTVGHAVTRNFLTNKPRNQGIVVDLAGGAPFYLRDLSAGNREGVATSSDFNVLSGGPVTITVLAVSPGVNPATVLDAPALPDDGKLRRGVFRLTGYGTQTVTYTAGGADASTDIGDREPTVPKADPADPGRDWGDYGVMFTLTMALNNPTDVPQTAYFYESPRGGPARASYLVDGQLYELGCATSARSATDSPHRYQIGAAVVLAPHTTQTHVLRTMTDGGSNLPIEIGISAAVPQPSTPPISAPDGCFPKPLPQPEPAPAATPQTLPSPPSF